MRKPERFRISLSLLVASLITVLLVGVFAIVTPLVLSRMRAQLKQSLIDQSKAFAVLSTRPIGDAFVLYQDGGRTTLDQQVQGIVSTDPYVSNVSIFDVSNKLQYQATTDKTHISADEAGTFDPLYEFDHDGYITRVIYPLIEQSGAHRYTIVYAVDSSSIKASLALLQRQVLIGALVILVIGELIFVGLFQFIFVIPLKNMSKLAAAISAGNYDVSIPLKRKDEIRDLGDALNNMAQKLKADITALKRAEELKSEFLVISSHNLRTPITVMTGYLDLLDEAQLDEKSRGYVNVMRNYANELRDLTQDMLTVAELEGNAQLKVTLKPVNLVDFINGNLDEMRTKANEKSQTLEIELPNMPPTIEAQETYLRTSLWNIYDNATKFTPEHGIIRLTVGVDGDSVRLTVRDTGAGIHPEEQARLFTKFHRGTSMLRYDYEGVGLGLYMTKMMVDLMHGQIDVKSELGKGSTFTLVFPKPPSNPTDPHQTSTSADQKA